MESYQALTRAVPNVEFKMTDCQPIPLGSTWEEAYQDAKTCGCGDGYEREMGERRKTQLEASRKRQAGGQRLVVSRCRHFCAEVKEMHSTGGDM